MNDTHQHFWRYQPDRDTWIDDSMQAFKSNMNGLKAACKHNYSYDVLIDQHQMDEAVPLFSKLSEFPQIRVKLSSLVTEADRSSWHAEVLLTDVETVQESFSADRIMYGSDWPVCLLGATYGFVLKVVKKFCQSLSPREQKKILSLYAKKFYNIY